MIKIISGGQAGADLGALEAARQTRNPTGGFAPYNWMSGGEERQELLESYGLIAAPYDKYTYPLRTRMNVDAADLTIAFLWGPSAGTQRTVGYAVLGRWLRFTEYPIGLVRLIEGKRKPVILVRSQDVELAANQILEVLRALKPQVVNVAGSREVKCPGMEKFVYRVMLKVLLASNSLL